MSMLHAAAVGWKKGMSWFEAMLNSEKIQTLV